jgi:hypothetical protein
MLARSLRLLVVSLMMPLPLAAQSCWEQHKNSGKMQPVLNCLESKIAALEAPGDQRSSVETMAAGKKYKATSNGWVVVNLRAKPNENERGLYATGKVNDIARASASAVDYTDRKSPFMNSFSMPVLSGEEWVVEITGGDADSYIVRWITF